MIRSKWQSITLKDEAWLELLMFLCHGQSFYSYLLILITFCDSVYKGNSYNCHEKSYFIVINLSSSRILDDRLVCNKSMKKPLGLELNISWTYITLKLSSY